MKTLGKVLLGIVGLVVLAVGVLFALSSRAVGKKYAVTAHPVAVPTDSASLARGAHLVEAVVACRDCHGENLGGGALAMGPVGTFVGPNLTSGTGAWRARRSSAWSWPSATASGPTAPRSSSCPPRRTPT